MTRLCNRLILIVTVTVVLLSGFCAPALAAPSKDLPTTTGGPQGQGALTDKYVATYWSTVGGGEWECHGVRVENATYVKDVFSCTISDVSTLPPGEYHGTTVPWYDGSGGPIWITDSDRSDGLTTLDLQITVTDNGDGTGTVEGVAIY